VGASAADPSACAGGGNAQAPDGGGPGCGVLVDQPNANFVYTGEPRVGGVTTLNAGNSRSGVAITAYDWDIDNDGQYDDATGQQPTHVFDTAGLYVVGLRITDDAGRTAVATRTLTVHAENFKPTGRIFANPLRPEPGTAYTFSSQVGDQDGQVTAQAWDLDEDGEFDDGAAGTVQFTYTTAGTRLIKLRLTDDGGATNTITTTIDVGSGATSKPRPLLYIGFSPLAGRLVNWDTTGSYDPDGGSIQSYAYDFEGDTAFESSSASFTYPSAGVGTARVQATDDEGEVGTASTEYTVHAANIAPRCEIFRNFLQTGSPGADESTSRFAPSPDPDTSVSGQAWDLDADGEFDDATGPSPSIVYSTAGKHTFSLRATDSVGGATAVCTEQLIVHSGRPTADFTWNKSDPNTQQSVMFTSTATDSDGTIAATAWDLDNDGQYDDATGTTANRVFATAGVHRVGMRVTDDNGDLGFAATNITVTLANQPPSDTFTVAPTSPNVGQLATFTSTATDSDGAIQSTEWDFDDDGDFDVGGPTGTGTTHTFTTAGTHVVRMRVTDDDGVSVVGVKQVAVNAFPAVDFTWDPPKKGQPTELRATASDPDGTVQTIEWDFDDDGDFDAGGPGGATVQHAFAEARNYTVRVRATDNSGASAVSSHVVNVAQEKVSDEVTPQKIQAGGGEVEVTTANDSTPFAVEAAVATSNPGKVEVAQSDVVSQEQPAGYQFSTFQVNIEAPPATKADPLRLTFDLDASLVPAGGPDAVVVFRNGTVVANCPAGMTVTSSLPSNLSHCVVSRTSHGAGGARLIVLAEHASAWNFGTVKGATPPDTTKPKAKLSLAPKQKLATVLKKGLTVLVTPTEAVTLNAALGLDKATAKKLKLKGSLGTLKKRKLVAGVKNKLVLKLSSKAAKALAKQKSVKLVVTLSFADASGNKGSLVTKPQTVKK
jgi:PKD repeat protein